MSLQIGSEGLLLSFQTAKRKIEQEINILQQRIDEQFKPQLLTAGVTVKAGTLEQISMTEGIIQQKKQEVQTLDFQISSVIENLNTFFKEEIIPLSTSTVITPAGEENIISAFPAELSTILPPDTSNLLLPGLVILGVILILR